jgi:DNA-binding LacI/PurR family transcriptional regulator
MTTMRDVARVAGVSAKTVSRVFNDDLHVTEETRDRVRWAMQKLNYLPNLLARSFRAGADTAVGLAVPDIADPFFATMTSSIEEDLGGASEAVTHLASHGHQRIAFFGVSTPVATTRRRLKGYRSALAENGLPDRPDLVCMTAESPGESAAELMKRLAEPDPPTAVFSSNIPCTMALVLALHRAGRNNVAVVGFGDIPMAEALAPAVTVVNQDPAGLGRIAVDRLLQRIKDPHAPLQRRTVLPVHLIPRGSGELSPA